jgi:cytochrome b6-f complex iron-sulfur subunit
MRSVVVAIMHGYRKPEIDRLPTTSRRGFLTWWMAGLMAATVGAVVGPVAVFVWPPPTAGQVKKKISVTLAQTVASLVEGAAARFDAPPNASFTMADGGEANSPGGATFGGYLTRHGGVLRALAITCPHLGCSYGFDSGLGHFLCPCHGSQFTLDGKILHGPATSPLSHLTWEQGAAPDEILVEGMTMN